MFGLLEGIRVGLIVGLTDGLLVGIDFKLVELIVRMKV